MQEIRRQHVTSRTCAICKIRYKPRWEEQRTCGGPCARALAGKDRYPKQFAIQISRRKAQRKAEIERHCARRWPELSVREIEIFNFAVSVGYQRGYNKGYAELKRKYTKAAA